MRLVLDTNVVLDLLFFRDPATTPLRDALEAGRAECVTDARCLDELRVVLERSPFAQRPAEAESVRTEYQASAAVQPPDPAGAAASGLPRCRDPADQKFLEIAVRARADLLVTKDKALLELARARSRLGGLRIVTPIGAALALQGEPVQSRT